MYSKETIIEILLFQLCYFRLRNIPDSEKVFIRYNSLDIKTNKIFCAPNFCLQPLVINSRHWHILGKCVTTELHPQWESLSIHLVRVLLLLVFCFFLLFPFLHFILIHDLTKLYRLYLNFLCDLHRDSTSQSLPPGLYLRMSEGIIYEFMEIINIQLRIS